MKCRVCGQPLKRILTLHDQPSQAQYLSDAKTCDLRVARCNCCRVVQLTNEPVSYWNEAIDTGDASPAMRAFRDVQEAAWGPLDFILRNRLEHVPDPIGYLRAFRGRGVIEVPNIVGLRPDEFVADHLFYFEQDTLADTLRRAGMRVLYIEAVWHGHILSAHVERERAAVWGAGHQALAMMRLYGITPDYIVDSAPSKQYQTVAGVQTFPPIALMDMPPETLYVACAGFNDEVCEQARALGYEGSIVRFDDGRFVDADGE